MSKLWRICIYIDILIRELFWHFMQYFCLRCGFVSGVSNLQVNKQFSSDFSDDIYSKCYDVRIELNKLDLMALHRISGKNDKRKLYIQIAKLKSPLYTWLWLDQTDSSECDYWKRLRPDWRKPRRLTSVLWLNMINISY